MARREKEGLDTFISPAGDPKIKIIRHCAALQLPAVQSIRPEVLPVLREAEPQFMPVDF
jgi:hypothetical protein